jgi:transcriptional antiterminator NusG
MSGSPVDPSEEAVPEGTPPTPDEEPKKDADDPRERVIEAFEEAAGREAVADAAIEEALEETVAEAIADAESVEAASDAAIQEAYEEKVEEAVGSGLEGAALEDAVAQAAADADVQEAIADEAIVEALEETVVEAVQDARSVEAMSDAAIVGELADEVEGIAAEVEAREAAGAEPTGTSEAAEAAPLEPPTPAAPTEAEDEPKTATPEPEPDEPAETFEAGSDPFRGPGEWYVVHTYAGYENKVKTNLESRIHTMQMEDKIFDVHIPMEDVMEIKSGKKQVVQRKVFPGYLLVKMVYDNDSWYVVRNTPGVTGFVAAGTGSKPTPLSRREVEKILAVKKEEVKPTFRLGFEENDVVRIISGPFADFNGTISEINLDQSKLKVLVNIFDRETPVELSFDQVAKV